ncbi:hypothetical protein ASE00_01370 [Sphingomonas sp. Root710]|nr:hypothetical protein ASE00_01370 [Sphingomonas sp. Root710]
MTSASSVVQPVVLAMRPPAASDPESELRAPSRPPNIARLLSPRMLSGRNDSHDLQFSMVDIGDRDWTADKCNA